MSVGFEVEIDWVTVIFKTAVSQTTWKHHVKYIPSWTARVFVPLIGRGIIKKKAVKNMEMKANVNVVTFQKKWRSIGRKSKKHLATT